MEGRSPLEVARDWVDAAVAQAGRARGRPRNRFAISIASDRRRRARPTCAPSSCASLDERGPGFVTALTSAKGRELRAHPAVAAAPHVALDVPRHSLPRHRGPGRSRRGRGLLRLLAPTARGISARTSCQSEPIASRAAPEEAYERYAPRSGPTVGAPDDVPVPDFWGGFRIVPDEVEFWGGRRSRLHGSNRLLLHRFWQSGRW